MKRFSEMLNESGRTVIFNIKIKDGRKLMVKTASFGGEGTLRDLLNMNRWGSYEILSQKTVDEKPPYSPIVRVIG